MNKKSYITPGMTVVTVNTQKSMLIAVSVEGETINVNNNTGGNASDGLVKKNYGYNVWDDDWSLE